MIKTNLHLTERQMEVLRQLSDLGGLSVAEIVRRAIDDYLISLELWEEERRKAAGRTGE